MNRGKFSVNVASNVVYYAFSILINIWFTPYLIHHLGVAGFGIVPLAMTVVSYLSVFTLVLNAAVGRFITVNLEQGRYEEAGKFFNTSLVASLIFVVVMTLPCLWLALHPQWFLSLPEGQDNQAVLLFVCMLFMFMLTVVSSPFEVATFCSNRFDIRNGVAALASITRVVLVVLMFNAFHAQVWHVGVGILAATILSMGGSLWAWRKLTPELIVDVRQFSAAALKELSGPGVWIAFNQLGTILLLSIDLLVVNRLLGVYSGGRYASLMQWSALLRGLGTTIAGVLAPTIIYYYARNEIAELITYARQAVKFIGLIIALPVGLVSGLAKPLLLVWLGPDFVTLAPLMVLMTVHLSLNLGYLPLHNISTATNKVRIPALFQVFIGVLNLVLALVLAGPAGWGMYGVATAGAIALIIKNIVFTPIYGARILGKNPGIFMKELLPIIFVGSFITIISWLMSSYINLNSWPKLLCYSISFTCLYVPSVWLTLLNIEEKLLIKKTLNIAQV